MKEMSLALLLLLFQALTAAARDGHGSDWNYDLRGERGPAHWAGICAAGSAQSPVDLAPPETLTESEYLQPVFKNIKPFVFKHYAEEPWLVRVANNGHSFVVTLQSKPGKEPRIEGGGLEESLRYHPDDGNDNNSTNKTSFEFAQLHFHWGGADDRGSEHTVAGRAYAMEMHLVHFNTKYEDLKTAASQPDGLAVLGVFFQVSTKDNPYIDRLINGVLHVKMPGKEVALKKVIRLKDLLPGQAKHFFRYRGSLTTPPCSESVTWTVFVQPVEVSASQLWQLRSLFDLDDKKLADNFRPVQPINRRKVFINKKNYNSSDFAPKKISPQRYDPYHEQPEEMDHFFLLIMSVIIFFMQCGFAFMEAGAVRSKNTVNILIKNWLDMCLGALVYWAVGFGLTFGESTPGLARFMGTSYFFFYDMPAYKLSKWFFQFVFAATAATLVSGSLAERCNFIAYIVYSIMITGFIYPMIAHWTWHREGWLRIQGYYDFAGSGVVHLTGAVCALTGCVLMGPRIGRFDKNGRAVPMPGHSVPLSALGGLILVFGFFACNGTKQGSISHAGDGVAIATAIVNTALGTSAAGLATLIFNKTGIVPGTGGNYSFLLTMNGSLTGTVALCAGCNAFPAWAAVVVGAISGPLFLFFNYLLLRMRIDDPLDAIPVHGVGGMWGTLSVYIFKWDGILMTGSRASFIGLGWNVAGLLAIICWTATLCFVMFYLLKIFRMLRVETEHEFKGMDLLKHGESAYPADAWVEAQYMSGAGDIASNGETVGGDGQGSSCRSRRSGRSISSPNPLGGSGGGGRDHKGKLSSERRDGLPPNMTFSRAASYNNPHEMFPSASRLFSGMNSVAGGVTVWPAANNGESGDNKMETLAESASPDEIAPLKEPDEEATIISG